jgi:arylsulfatase B
MNTLVANRLVRLTLTAVTLAACHTAEPTANEAASDEATTHESAAQRQSSVHVASSNAKPLRNTLIILADDYGVDVSPLYPVASPGNPTSFSPNVDAQATPNLASLLTRGVRFTNAWANPSCSPTRASMFTGRYGFRTGVGMPIAPGAPQGQLDLTEFGLPRALDANPHLGYAHGNVGKWHLSTQPGDPNTAGWGFFSGSLIGLIDQNSPDTYYFWNKTVQGVTTPGHRVYSTTDNINDAITWVNEQDGQNKPWLLWLGLMAPHAPFQLPPNDLHDYDHLPNTAADIAANPVPYFKAMVQAMDTELGRLFAQVSLDETNIIFLGDNGTDRAVVRPPFDSTRAKGTLYEGGLRVPLLVAGPDVAQPNRVSPALVNASDIYATALELSGVDVTATLPAGVTLDSVSLVPVLKNAPGPRRTWAFAEQFSPSGANVPPIFQMGKAIRSPRYKLIQLDNGTRAFYDLISDPYEKNDLLLGSLTTIEQLAYDGLSSKLATLLASEP